MKMDVLELTVVKKTFPTDDSVTLELIRADDQPFAYHAGQFINLFFKFPDEETQRSYSFSSSPVVDKNPSITVKRVEGGLVSNHIVDAVKEGDQLSSSQPLGQFFDPYGYSEGQKTFLMFCAGSGVTPLISIAKTLLHTSEHKIYFIYSNKNRGSIIFDNELEHLDKEFNNFHLHHHISEKDPGECLPRLDETSIEKYLLSLELSNTEVFVCGPNAYSDVIKNVCKHKNLPMSQFHLESFTHDVKINEGDDFKVYIGEPEKKAPTKVRIKANIEGNEVEIDASPEDTLLDALLNANESPPFSCMAGACMACIAYVKKGEVWQEEYAVLTEKGVEQGQTLTCQSKPLTDYVEIEYE